MSHFTEKDRLLSVLRKERVDRPPVICTGGMMNAAIVDVMRDTGLTLPAGHSDPQLMASLAEAIHRRTGFENIGLPFCMTIEAELLGSTVDLGTLACEPKIALEPFATSSVVEYREIVPLVRSGRAAVVTQAAKLVTTRNPGVPVIASLTGPVSTAASVVQPLAFYKDMRKDPTAAHRVLDYVTNFLVEFATVLVREGGVTAVMIGDPSATGEILGPAMFGAFAVPYLNRLADAIRAIGVPPILHICGNLKRVDHLVTQLRFAALSTDAMINLAALKREHPGLVTMGNLSTYALEFTDTEKIRRMTRQLVESGIDILSPACGLSTSTKLEAIRAFTDTVRDRN
ncbi:MAG: uroporphyrinogen decarboxylase family protein [Opitutaceae bacterium]